MEEFENLLISWITYSCFDHFDTRYNQEIHGIVRDKNFLIWENTYLYLLEKQNWILEISALNILFYVTVRSKYNQISKLTILKETLTKNLKNYGRLTSLHVRRESKWIFSELWEDRIENWDGNLQWVYSPTPISKLFSIFWQVMLREHLQISLVLLSKFKRINQLLFSVKLWENLRFFDGLNGGIEVN